VGGRDLACSVWPRRSARSLLLFLLMTPEHRIARDWAVDLLWPHLAKDSARNTWYQTLATLRRILEPSLGRRQASSFVTTDATTIALADDLAVWVDVDAFEAALRRARDGSLAERRAALRAALALYRGDLLAEEPADWAISRQQALHGAWRHAVLQLGELDRQCGEPVASARALHAVLAVAGERDQARR
jgi:DNA-binding SARP family transcriptional activator